MCQHPILHDMEITSSVVSGYTGSNDQMISTSNIARKNLAATQSAILKSYKSRRSEAVCVTYGSGRYSSWCNSPYTRKVMKQEKF